MERERGKGKKRRSHLIIHALLYLKVFAKRKERTRA
jgi:hypothetical protein